MATPPPCVRLRVKAQQAVLTPGGFLLRLATTSNLVPARETELLLLKSSTVSGTVSQILFLACGVGIERGPEVGDGDLFVCIGAIEGRC